MRKLVYLILLLPLGSSAQINITFESGALNGWQESFHGRWNASAVNPISGNYSLHHIFDNPEAGHDQISFPVYTIALDSASTTWRFKLKYGYNPSSANHWGVFLSSDQNAFQMHPAGTTNGYLIGVNYTGSNDILTLWEISSGSASEVINTGFNWQEEVLLNEVIGFEINRSRMGMWEILIDTTGSYSNLISLGTALNSNWLQFRHMGIYYKYSSSQDRKLWVDDILIDGYFVTDTMNPYLEKINVMSANRVEVVFSEPVLPETATDPLNYSFDRGIGNPISVQLTESDKVVLTVQDELQDGVTYILTVQHVEDLHNNRIIQQSIECTYYEIGPFDILINEIMADPTPSIELPEEEFVEIFNTTQHPVYMAGWSLQVGGKVKPLDGIEIPENSYLILCSNSAIDRFELFGHVHGISGFPALVNAGQTIAIRDDQNVIISSVTYHEDWYRDNYKAEGGWSLEQIDPGNPCGGAANWMASTDAMGGTPGRQNSVIGDNPDTENPFLQNAYIHNDTSLFLTFNEPYDSANAVNQNEYIVNNGVGSPSSIRLIAPQYHSLLLNFQQPFEEGIIYTINVDANVTDCFGNPMGINSRKFGYPQKADSLDLIINEVLFNPLPSGVDYVEIINISNKIVDLKDLRLASRDENSSCLTSIVPIVEQPFLLFPDEYLVFSTSAATVFSQYYTSNPLGYVDLNKMPSLPNESGRIVLIDKWQAVLDEFGYSEDMHFPLLRIVEGVSLERILPTAATADPHNWHSASESCGFGTPAYENSQYNEDPVSEKRRITVEPELFSPDNDGYNDIVRVMYEFDQPGYVANVTIFDARGRIVRKLVNNELLGMEGSFLWNGLNDANMVPNMGIYLFFIEVFDLNGNVSYFKKTCVLAKKLNPP
jgi:hypothetical protein